MSHDLASRFRYVDHREEALSAMEEVVEIYRWLALDSPEVFSIKLARSLHDLEEYLSNVGRREDALDAIQEAVQLIRQLASHRPEVFDEDLSTSLNSLSICFSFTGQQEKAIDTIREAVDISRKDMSGSHASIEQLARFLVNLSVTLKDFGRVGDALPPIQEAFNIFSRLTPESSTDNDHLKATILNNLSDCLFDHGRREDAMDAVRESIEIRRQLASTVQALLVKT